VCLQSLGEALAPNLHPLTPLQSLSLIGRRERIDLQTQPSISLFGDRLFLEAEAMT
jgi:hypothetical protein